MSLSSQAYNVLVPYPEFFVAPMRQELSDLVRELRTRQRLTQPSPAPPARAPSSPCVALMCNRELVYMLERSDIESRDACTIATRLTAAFEEYCLLQV